MRREGGFSTTASESSRDCHAFCTRKDLPGPMQTQIMYAKIASTQ
jgi:hypothetical protein